ncbi:MAG: pimeloyl-ACP methyl ester carboxylesterase [Rhodococcus sp. (in: high G+C Gram-positive bacteria)]|jgi:pimeloyl-ACP methyl ester carboxylesterase
MTIREKMIEADGYRVSVRQAGEGFPVLLIHGVGCHAGMWAPIEAAWTKQRLVSFDPPGLGKSPARVRPTSITALAQLAEALLDELGLGRVDVLGYSLGGTVAQTLARRSPQRVRRLVLVATAPGWGSVPGRWRSMMHLYTPLRFLSRSYYKRTIGIVAGGQARTSNAFVERHAAELLRERPSILRYWSQVLAAGTWSSLSWLNEIKAPTLVVSGGDDPLIPPANGVILASRIPSARMQLFPDDGHLVLFDADSPAIPFIEEFLTAASLDDSSSWATAVKMNDEDESTTIRTTPVGMFPWGMASAAYRTVQPALMPQRSCETDGTRQTGG